MERNMCIRSVLAVCVGLLVTLGYPAYAQCPPDPPAPPKVEIVADQPREATVTPVEARIAQLEAQIRVLIARCDDLPRLVASILCPFQLPQLGKRVQDLEAVTLDLQTNLRSVPSTLVRLDSAIAGVAARLAKLETEATLRFDAAIGGILETLGKTRRDLEAVQDSVSHLRSVPSTLVRLDSAIAGVAARLGKLETETTLRFDEVQKALARLSTMSERLETADQTARAALAGVAQNDDRLDALEGATQRLRRDLDPVPVEIGALTLRVRALESDVSELQELTRALMNRVIELERRLCPPANDPAPGALVWIVVAAVGGIALLVLMNQ